MVACSKTLTRQREKRAAWRYVLELKSEQNVGEEVEELPPCLWNGEKHSKMQYWSNAHAHSLWDYSQLHPSLTGHGILSAVGSNSILQCLSCWHYMSTRDSNSIYLMDLLWEFNELVFITWLKECLVCTWSYIIYSYYYYHLLSPGTIGWVNSCNAFKEVSGT